MFSGSVARFSVSSSSLSSHLRLIFDVDDDDDDDDQLMSRFVNCMSLSG